jgi:uncharacterized protein (TIGR03435 family)
MVFLAAAVSAGYAVDVHAQSHPAEFDAASIRPNKTGDRDSNGRALGATYVATNVTLRQLIQDAYQMTPARVVGGPSWIDSERYDVVAKSASRPSPDEHRAMMRTLLADRFQLRLHEDKRKIETVAVVVARADRSLGPGIHPVADSECQRQPPEDPNRPTPLAERPCVGAVRVGLIEWHGMTMKSLATMLQYTFRVAPAVIDRTGLTGLYDVKLSWEPDGPGGAPPADGGPALQTALREQLGLKLEQTSEETMIYVIDSAQRPTAD